MQTSLGKEQQTPRDVFHDLCFSSALIGSLSLADLHSFVCYLKNICFLYSLTPVHSAHSSESHMSRILSIMPTNIPLPLMLPWWIFKIWKGILTATFNSFQKKNAIVIRKQQIAVKGVHFKKSETYMC